MTSIQMALRPMRRRMRLRRMVTWTAYGAFVGAACALLVRVASFLWLLSNAWLWEWIAFLSGLAAFALGAWLWPISDLAVAREADGLGLKARAQTALMLESLDTPMARVQREDALRALSGLNAKALPLKAPKPAWIGALTCAALFGLSFFLPNPQQEALDAKAAIQESLAQQAEQVQAAATSLDENAVTAQALMKELARELDKAQTAREALLAIDRAERSLNEALSQMLTDAAAALESAGQDALAQALMQGDSQALARKLASIPDASKALAAAAASAASAEAAQSLSAAAQALESMDADLAAQELTALSDSTAQALEAMANARTAAAGASTSSAGASLGSGGEETQDANGQSAFVSPQAPQKQTREYEAVYDPTRLGVSGTVTQERGVWHEGTIYEADAGTGEGAPEESVPYNRVFAEYAQAATDAMQSSNLPLWAREWVEEYFQALQP